MNLWMAVFIVFLNNALGASAALFVKQGTKKGLTNFDVLNGLFLYGASAIVFVMALKYAPVSVLYPVTAGTWIWSIIFAGFFLKEKISLKKSFGILLVLSGIVLIAIA